MSATVVNAEDDTVLDDVMDFDGENYCYEDSDGNNVLNDSLTKPWEEVYFLRNNDEAQLKALNELLRDSFYIYSATPVGDTVFIRLRSIDPVEV
jgi:hypothetical protein